MVSRMKGNAKAVAQSCVEKLMIRKKVPMFVLLIVALIGAVGWLSQMPALGNSKDNKTPYPGMD